MRSKFSEHRPARCACKCLQSSVYCRHKEILSDPAFMGISSINTGSITFGIRAECKESRMRKVRSILNYEIRDILNRNNIDLL